MGTKYRVISTTGSGKKKEIKIEGEFDAYNLSDMRKCASQVVSKFLRKKVEGGISIQVTKHGVTSAEAVISVSFPKYEEA